MESTPVTRPVYLNPGALTRLRNAKGRTVTIERGEVWITQENDVRDVILEEHGTFTFDRDGVALAYAFAAPTILAVEEGIVIEHVTHPALRVSAYVLPGSPVYRREHELRARAVEELLQKFSVWLRCSSRNLLHRAGLPVQPC